MKEYIREMDCKRAWELYRNVWWRRLTPSQLSNEGMRLIELDPTLSQSTMNALKRSEASILAKYTKHPYYDPNYVAYGVLNCCLSESPNCTMADLVARYVESRNEPFIVGAILLVGLIKRYGFFVYKKKTIVSDERHTSYTDCVWVPKPASSMRVSVGTAAQFDSIPNYTKRRAREEYEKRVERQRQRSARGRPKNVNLPSNNKAKEPNT